MLIDWVKKSFGIELRSRFTT